MEQAALVDIPVPSPAHNELLDAEHIAQMNPVTRLIRRTVADFSDIVQFLSQPEKVWLVRVLGATQGLPE